MNEAQRNEMKLRVAEDTSYALFRVTTGALHLKYRFNPTLRSAVRL